MAAWTNVLAVVVGSFGLGSLLTYLIMVVSQGKKDG